MTKARTLADNFAADINQVNAGVGITGGGTSGTVTITNDMATTINAAGDLVYGTANDAYTRLGIGTAGQYLKVNSGATAPEWATLSAGGMTELATGTLSGSAVSITSISGSYKNLVLVVRNFKPATDDANLRMRFNNDSNARYAFTSSNASNGELFGDTSMNVASGNDNSVATGLIYITIPDYANTVTWKYFNALSVQVNATTTTSGNFQHRFGAYNQTTAVTEINLLSSSGNLTSGDYILYGVS